MSNKQVVAIFIAGLLMMLIAFGAGLSVIKNSLVSSTNTIEVTAAKPQPQPKIESNVQASTQPSGEITPSAENTVVRYVIKFQQAYATKEAAEQRRMELRSKSYLSAYVQEGKDPDTLYYVNVGPYETRDEAQRIVNELSSDGYKGMMIYTMK